MDKQEGKMKTNIFVSTGNGDFDFADPNNPDFGDSVLKLSSPSLTVTDFFTPFDQDILSAFDLDLGSGAAILLPDQPGDHPHLMVAAGKTGKIYLLDRDNLGQFQRCGPSCDDVVEVTDPDTVTGGSFGAPAYFNNTIYYAGTSAQLSAFAIVGGFLSVVPVSQSPTFFSFPGATPSISANGSVNPIVWALDVSGFADGSPAILHAYDALNLANELYASDQAGPRDQLDGAVKFTVPTIANGKVYVGTQSSLAVLGLFP